MPNNRDEFPAEVKRVIRERAASFCSNPNCRNLTTGPHSDPEKSLIEGIAAHICAAQPKGPRYDPKQTATERKSIFNAIWLCHNCSDKVDKDAVEYPKELLIQWKNTHEDFIKGKRYVPTFPEITLNTYLGLLSNFTTPISHEQQNLLRQHRLMMRNINTTVIHDIHLTLQFPEVILNNTFTGNVPAGIDIQCRPDNQLVVMGSMEIIGNIIDGASNYIMTIDKLLPRQEISVDWLSVQNPHEVDRDYSLNKDRLLIFIRGSFQYEFSNSFYVREFIVPLLYDPEQRMVTSLPPDDGLNLKIRRRFSLPY